ncbi:MAG TPA: carboxypeptidase-like regulatory domain-containing protein, partial [Blastocatellia bacterium]|nr:carboxypeptidase-like regulatory domain-containing protein [Blastocatellia bacterium]
MAKRDDVFRIQGRIIDRATGRGVAGLRVEAWDKDLICDDLVGSAVTDARGAFRVEFDESYFEESFLDRRPELFFKVFQDGVCIRSTEDSVLWNAETGTTEISIEVELARPQPTPTPRPSALESPSLEVRGTVRLSDGSPAEKVTVSAFDRDLRSEQLLGQTETDETGFYRVRYSADQTLRGEKGSADLVIKATASDGSLLVASRVLFNAPPVAELDLLIPAEALAPPSLFEKVGRELAPLTAGLEVEELEEDEKHQDLSFLSGETGFDIEVLARFVLAHRLKRRGLEAEFWFALLGGSFFDYTREKSLAGQAEAVLDSLPSLDAAAVRRSLISALNRRDISESFRERAEEWVEAFLQFAAQQLVRDSEKPGFVKQALEDARITDAKKQETFARLFAEQKALTPELIDALEKDASFQREEIDDLRTSFRLAELTRGDFAIVKAIKDEFGVRQPEQIRTLAKRSEREWVELVKAKREAGEINLPIETAATPGFGKPPEEEIYGKTLERQFREAFPTAAFAGSLARAARDGGTRGLRQAQLLGGFLERHEDFELLHTPVEDFLNSHTDPETKRLAGDEDFKLELKAVQRVFKLAPTFEATDALLADDIHSAQQVYRLGKTEFVRRYDGRGFTAESAAKAWDKAADTHAAVLTIVSDLKALEPGSLPQALTSDGEEAFKSFPNWENLFQAGDLCACEHCRSVLSPAAYFADLLMFLKDRKADNPAFT